MIGTSAAEEDDVLAELSRSQVYFEDMSLEEIYKAVQKEVSTPILYMTYFPESYVIKEAKYDREYGLLNLKFENDEKTVYVSQRKVDDECSIGLISDEQILETVDNQALGEQISIFRSEQDESCAFAVAFGNRELVFNGKIALDECKKIAESIHYGK